MRSRSPRERFAILFGTAGVLSFSMTLSAAETHPVVAELRSTFPTVAMESSVPFDSSHTFVGGRMVTGLRARLVRPALSVLYPHSYDGLIVVESGSQRVVLRAVAATPTPVTESSGRLVYSRPYASTDIVEIPNGGRSEELLLMHDRSAPTAFEYEIVATEGVAGLALNDGAIRFLPTITEPPPVAEIAGGSFTQLPLSLQIDKPWLIDAAGKRSETQARWTLVGSGAIPKSLRLTVKPERLAFPIVIDPSFSVTGSLGTARGRQTATLLPNGKVLIAGGIAANTFSSAELYDPASGTFSATGSMAVARYGHTATLLPTGKVLIAGGESNNPGGGLTASAELYDPMTGTFSATGSLVGARFGHTATLLKNGKVLVAAGSVGIALASAEIYDPVNGKFTATGNLGTAREFLAAALLQDGRVLFAGGYDSSAIPLSSAEIYDPAAGAFSSTGSLNTARVYDTLTTLTNGKVLVVGGFDSSLNTTSSAEIYDPSAGTFTPTGSLATARYAHTVTLLPNGKALVVGGLNSNTNTFLTAAELYDPGSGTFNTAANLTTGRIEHTATLLASGNVLVVGGRNASTLGSAEIYDGGGASFNATASLSTARYAATATLLPNSKVLIAGGRIANGELSSAELFDPTTGTFSATGNLMAARSFAVATLLRNGKVLIEGGYNATSGYLTSAELYDPASGTFAFTGGLATARAFSTATLLPNGKVLVAGGRNAANGDLSSAELYDPASATFSATASLGSAREVPTATLLPTGRVLIAGGYNGSSGTLNTAELYDPVTGAFVSTGSLGAVRSGATATLLPNGNVLIVGGDDPTGPLASAELYDYLSGTFNATGSLSTARDAATSALLPNGKALIAGGSVNVASAELYDPAIGTFSATATLATARASATATLLPNGKVLVAGGNNSTNGSLASAELYDSGLGFVDAQRPVINSAPSTLNLPAMLTLIGSGFRGDSTASNGSVNDSATNFPLLQMQRLDNEQSVFLAPTSAWSDVAWSGTLTNLPAGFYRATIYTNAIPSIEQIIQVVQAIPTIANVSPNRGVATGGQIVIITGTNLLDASVTIGGNFATVIDTTSTTVTFVTPAHSIGAVDVTVTTPGGMSATSAGAYTYVANPPTNVIAAAQTATSVKIDWTAAPGATGYDVLRSADGVNYTPLGGVASTSFTDLTASSGTAYLYAVRANAPNVSDNSLPDLATTVIFMDDPLIPGATIVKSIHVTQLRTAVNAVCVLAGVTSPTYTDPTITAGTTTIKAAHVSELRTALNAARGHLPLPAVVYTQPSPTTGALIRASDIIDLRNGVK